MTTYQETKPSASTKINSSQPSEMVSVWDPLVRIFHWTLVISFIVAYVSEDDYLTVHTWAGYTILSLLMIRILWGVIGTQHAKFSDFVFSGKEIVQFIKDTFSFRAKRYLGHNPAGGLMIFLLLFSLLLTTTTGLTVFALEEGQGPLAPLFSEHISLSASTAENLEDVIEELHEFFANFTVFLIVIHIVGVVFESLVHRENLAKSMITGKKRTK